jgi:hypothetical protein
MQIAAYNFHLGLLRPEPFLVGTAKVYSGRREADVLMSSPTGDSASLRFLSPVGVRALVETLLQLEAKRSGVAAQRTDFRRTAEAKP